MAKKKTAKQKSTKKKNNQPSKKNKQNRQSSSSKKPIQPSNYASLPLSKVGNQFEYRIEMRSDWHIGSGAGRTGDVDRLILRDRDGFPYIPAKSMTGIWRDACEQVANGFDNGVKGIWHQTLEYLFGSQPNLRKQDFHIPIQTAAISIRSAHLQSALRAAIQQKPQTIRQRYLDACTFIKPGISIDPKTGVAREQFLRFEEMARAGTQLIGTVSIQDPAFQKLPKAQHQRAIALLLAGSIYIERLGGKRRRGAGRCRLTIPGSHLALDDLEQVIQQSPSDTTERISHDFPRLDWNNSQDSAETSSQYMALDLSITVNKPVIMTQCKKGNLVETLDYIPGTHLLRYVMKCLSPLQADLVYALTHGEIIITDATLALDEKPGLPTPFAFYGEKKSGGLASEGKVLNQLVEHRTSDDQLKQERGGYLQLEGDRILYDRVNLGIQTHNTIKDDIQRPDAEVGGVYSYEAIATGTVLMAQLRLPSYLCEQLTAQDKQWIQNLDGHTAIGLSKKDDYGQVTITPGTALKACPQTIPLQNNLLTVWLLSDLLLRDEALRPVSDPAEFAQQLAKALSLDSLPLRQSPDLISAMSRHHRLESWHVRWGLPRPSLVGLAKGSCFVFELPDLSPTQKTALPQQLAQIAAKGFGERRAEGFGQLRFNDPLLTEAVSSRKIRSNGSTLDDSISDNSEVTLENKSYVQLLETTVLRRLIQEQVLAIANSSQQRYDVLGMGGSSGAIIDFPSMSQWGQLRSLIVSGDIGKIRQHVTAWLKRIQSKTDCEKRWSSHALEQIEQLVSSNKRVWQILDLENQFSNYLLNSQQTNDLQIQLAGEAVRALIDACIRAHKRELENQAMVSEEALPHG